MKGPLFRRGISVLATTILCVAVDAGFLGAQTQAKSDVQPTRTGLAFVVVDATGAVISTAKVEMEDSDGGVAFGQTDSSGTLIAGLTPGLYKIIIRVPGFETYKANIVVMSGIMTEMPVTMGSAWTPSDPPGKAPSIATESSSLASELLPEPSLAESTMASLPKQESKRSPRPNGLKRFFHKLGF